MSVRKREADAVVEAFARQLGTYTAAHPAAEIDVYRHGDVSVRVRVTDPDFRGKTRSARHNDVWPLLERLDLATLSELGMLVLVAPDEKDTSALNRGFDAGRPAAPAASTLNGSSPTRGRKSRH